MKIKGLSGCIFKRAIFNFFVLLLAPVMIGILGSLVNIIWFNINFFDPELPPLGVKSLELTTLFCASLIQLFLSLKILSAGLLIRVPVACVLGLWAFIRAGSVYTVFVGYFAYCCCCDRPYLWKDALIVILNPLNPFI